MRRETDEILKRKLSHDLFFLSSRRRHTRSKRDWSSDVCSSDLYAIEFEADCSRPVLTSDVALEIVAPQHPISHVVTHSLGAHAQPVHLDIDPDRVSRSKGQAPLEVSEHCRPIDERVTVPRLRQERVADCRTGLKRPQRDPELLTTQGVALARVREEHVAPGTRRQGDPPRIAPTCCALAPDATDQRRR